MVFELSYPGSGCYRQIEVGTKPGSPTAVLGCLDGQFLADFSHFGQVAERSIAAVLKTAYSSLMKPAKTQRFRQFSARNARKIQRSTRSEEHTSELQSLMRTSYAVFCLKKKKQNKT